MGEITDSKVHVRWAVVYDNGTVTTGLDEKWANKRYVEEVASMESDAVRLAKFELREVGE